MPLIKSLKIFVGLSSLLGFAALGSASRVAGASELYGGPNGDQPARVHSHHRALVAQPPCGWNCRGGCPDRYSCAPLYGSYNMPYGTPDYWSRYTYGGWTR
jgi:hypothetical protein